MGIQKDANGKTMISPRFDNKRECKRNSFTRTPIRNMLTMKQIKDAYQTSVLCISTRRAKEVGAWQNLDYCKDKIEGIRNCVGNEVFERAERRFIKKQRA